MAKISQQENSLELFGSSTKRNEFIRLTSESYRHARVSTIPSLGHFERRQKGNEENSPDGFFVAYFWRHKQRRKRSSCRETLAFGNARNFVKSLGSQFGSKQNSLLPHWIDFFSHGFDWKNLHISSDHRLSWDTKDSKLKIKSTSRIQRMVDTSWNPRGELAQRGEFFCVNLSEFLRGQMIHLIQPAKSSESSEPKGEESFAKESVNPLNWLKLQMSWKSPSFSRLHVVNRFCVSVCRKPGRLMSCAERLTIGKRHMKKNIDSNVFHKG